jgi:membrane protein
MAKFCTKCGKKLEDGKPCDCCKKEVKKEVVESKTNSFDFNECVNSYIEMVKGIFVKPIDTIKKFATSSNFVLGLIALAINCIVSGIFLYCIAKESINLISSFTGGYSSLLAMSSSIDVPFMKTFLYGILFMAVGFSVTALMIYVMAGVIFKDKIDMKKVFSLVGVCSVFTTVTTVVSIILNYISIKLMMVVLLISGIFYLTHLYQGVQETTEVDKNKLAYVFVPAISVATFVVVYVLPKILF